MRIEYTNGWYEGELDSSGRFDGYGELHKGSAVYKGNFSHGEYDGYGELVNGSGERYYGHYINGRMDGKGHLIKSNYDYDGDFSRNQPNGYGTLKTSEFRYTGQFCDGRIEGYGELDHSNGVHIKGYFIKGEAHGQCTYRNSEVEIRGEFQHGEPHGNCTITYRSGNRYEGNLAGGVYQGYGKFTYANGDVYEGSFERGKFHGIGKLTRRDGSVIEGEFKNGVAPASEDKAVTLEPTEKAEAITGGYRPAGAVRRTLSKDDDSSPDIDTSSRFYSDILKLIELRKAAHDYYPIHMSGFERAKAEVRREGGNPYNFCTWGYKIGDWCGMHYSGEKSGEVPYGYGYLSGINYSYRGYFANGQKSGYGIESTNGAQYEGCFQNGERHGFFEHRIGKKLYRLKFLFGVRELSYVEEYFVNGNAETAVFKGRCDFSNGNYIYKSGTLCKGGYLYTGSFVGGRLHGRVERVKDGVKEVLEYENGTELYNYKDLCDVRGNDYRYVGLMKDGLRHGRGECFYDDGGYYKGNWENDSWHGKGYVKHADGNSYEGDFVCYRYHGKGREVLANGAVYEGDWRDGHKTGKGSITTAEGDKYTGDFYINLYHGNGSIVYKSGDSYEGQFVNSIKNGKGKMQYASGDSYDGEWKDDNWHGNCTIKFKNAGITFSGYLDRYTGYTKGKLLYSDGSYRDGECKDFWTSHGKGVYVDAYGTTYEGEWIDGKKQGLFREYPKSKPKKYSICYYEADERKYYTEMNKDGFKLYKGRFVFHINGMVGYATVSNMYTGWIYNDEFYRGISYCSSDSYHDGEFNKSHPMANGRGLRVEDGKAIKGIFKDDKIHREKEKVTYLPSLDSLLKEDRSSVEWLERDAIKGNATSAYLCGIIYECGYFDKPKDSIKAFHFYKMAADAELPDALAALGRCYYDGIGTACDGKEAFRALNAAIKLDSRERRLKLYLARCYRGGFGVKPSEEMARYYYSSCYTSSPEERSERDEFLKYHR